jgi:trehalose synthase-fused probable maltokinase
MITLTPEILGEHVVSQRWFGEKSRDISEIVFVEAIPVRDHDPRLDLAIVEVRFATGTHALYQLPVGERPEGEELPDADVIHEGEGRVLYDALADPVLVRELVEAMGEDRQVDTSNGVAVFHTAPGARLTAENVRRLRAEQSNSSIVLDEDAVLKVFRHLGAGVNPELEMLSFLSRRAFPHVPGLRGWYAHTGGQLDATLGIVQDFVADAEDGWTLALQALQGDDPRSFAEHARELGEVTGRLHAVLASDPDDEDFAPGETSAEALGLLTATVDEEIERIFRDLPDDVPALERIRGRGEEVRDHLGMLTQVGSVGRVIRHHGDYHLGQVLRTREGEWKILDFEGEPARPVVERRAKRSPLRDVAGMLRSFAYAATASQLLHGHRAPDGWEQAMRDAFLAGYLGAVSSSLLPPGDAAVERLLTVFEMEKMVYELRYELDHRPDWVGIPAAGIARLLGIDDEPEVPA